MAPAIKLLHATHEKRKLENAKGGWSPLTLWRSLLPYGYSTTGCMATVSVKELMDSIRLLRFSISVSCASHAIPAINIDIVNYCRAEFNFELPGTVIEQRTSQFRDRTCDNLYCKLLCVWWWSAHCIIIVINCGLRNNLVKLVKFMFCFYCYHFGE